MSFNKDEFICQAELLKHSKEFIELTTLYADNLTRQDLPVIFSRKHLGQILDIPYFDLTAIINNPEALYKFYQIKKRNGRGKRQIMSPYSTLRKIQLYIMHEILQTVPIHRNCTGFVKKKSILQNAIPHKNKDAILNIDLLKFFDTVTQHRVYGIFKSLGYAKNLSIDFAKLITVKLPLEYLETFNKKELQSYRELVPEFSSVLPQGAPTSPIMANLILRRLDKRLTRLAEQCGVDYTRYADDITFSGEIEKIPSIRLLKIIIRDEGFNVNWNKVGIYKKGRKQIVTGLTVSNDVHIHRNFKKEIKKHIYACINFGVGEHLKFMNLENKNLYKEWLLGKIYYVKSIEPEIAKKMLDDFNKIVWIL